MIDTVLTWHELPGEALPPPGRTVLVHCPSDEPQKFTLAFYSDIKGWHDATQDGYPVMRHTVAAWAEVTLPK